MGNWTEFVRCVNKRNGYWDPRRGAAIVTTGKAIGYASVYCLEWPPFFGGSPVGLIKAI